MKLVTRKPHVGVNKRDLTKFLSAQPGHIESSNFKFSEFK